MTSCLSGTQTNPVTLSETTAVQHEFGALPFTVVESKGARSGFYGFHKYEPTDVMNSGVHAVRCVEDALTFTGTESSFDTPPGDVQSLKLSLFRGGGSRGGPPMVERSRPSTTLRDHPSGS